MDLSILFDMLGVGIGYFIVACVVHALFSLCLGWLIDAKSNVWLAVQIILAGALYHFLYHFLCEFFGANTWYCDMRCLKV